VTASSFALAVAGGVLVAVGLLLAAVAARRVVGVSGVVAGALRPQRGDLAWRLAFVTGLVGGGVLLSAIMPAALTFDVQRGLPTMALAGLLVGFGTRMSGGCTSGHGVCGIGRLSPRSMLATAVFVVTGAAVVYLLEHVGGPS
jgi:uncharacterized protein